jgi:hypothetical protein
MFTALRRLQVHGSQAPFINYVVCLAVLRGIQACTARWLGQVGAQARCALQARQLQQISRARAPTGAAVAATWARSRALTCRAARRRPAGPRQRAGHPHQVAQRHLLRLAQDRRRAHTHHLPGAPGRRPSGGGSGGSCCWQRRAHRRNGRAQASASLPCRLPYCLPYQRHHRTAASACSPAWGSTWTTRSPPPASTTSWPLSCGGRGRCVHWGWDRAGQGSSCRRRPLRSWPAPAITARRRHRLTPPPAHRAAGRGRRARGARGAAWPHPA